jgi:hypothetical protein
LQHAVLLLYSQEPLPYPPSVNVCMHACLCPVMSYHSVLISLSAIKSEEINATARILARPYFFVRDQLSAFVVHVSLRRSVAGAIEVFTAHKVERLGCALTWTQHLVNENVRLLHKIGVSGRRGRQFDVDLRQVRLLLRRLRCEDARFCKLGLYEHLQSCWLIGST